AHAFADGLLDAFGLGVATDDEPLLGGAQPLHAGKQLETVLGFAEHDIDDDQVEGRGAGIPARSLELPAGCTDVLGHRDLVTKVGEHTLSRAQLHRVVVHYQQPPGPATGDRRCSIRIGPALDAWEVESERGPLVEGALDVDEAVVFLHDSVHDGQPEPRTGVFREGLVGEKWFEDTPQVGGVDAAARVADLEHGVVSGADGFVGVERFVQLAGAGAQHDPAAARHGLDGIAQQIRHRPLQLSFRGGHHERYVGYLAGDIDSMPERMFPEQLVDFDAAAREAIQVERAFGHATLPPQRQQIFDRLGRPQRGPLQEVEVREHGVRRSSQVDPTQLVDD